MILTKLLSKTPFNIIKKLITSLILAAGIFLFVPFFALKERDTILKNPVSTKTNFYFILAAFFFQYMFCLIYQSYFTAIMASYNPKYTSYYFTFQALSNIIIMTQKSFSYSVKFNVESDFVLIWGSYTLLIFIAIFLTLKLTRTKKMRDVLNLDKQNSRSIEEKLNAPKKSTIISRENSTEVKGNFNYGKAWKIVKGDALGIFFTMMFCFSVFPGVLFSLPPATLFTLEEYILILNIIAAVFDLFFRPLAVKSYAKSLVYTSFFLAVFIIGFCIFNFMYEFQNQNEGVVYLIFVLLAFLIFRTSISVSFFMVNSSKKDLGDQGEGVASIMTNALHIGLAVGNIISNMVLVIKDSYVE